MIAGVVDTLTSKTGVVAAIVVVLGLLTAGQALLRPPLEARRNRRLEERRRAEALAQLEFSDVEIEPPLPWSRAGVARFEIVNSGGRAAVLQALRLEVIAHGPSEAVRVVQPGAPVVRHSHRVELVPGRDRYDIRGRIFGPEASPLSFAAGETEGFDVQLVSPEPHWFEFRFEAEWYDTKTPSEATTTSSSVTRLDFPQDQAPVA